jgi:outer membrane protein OmpA-like peptidoglycan-associated protein
MARSRNDGLHVWPAFTDLMGGLALLLLLLGLRESDRAARANRERRELEQQAQKLQSELDEERKKYGIQRKIVEGIQQTLKARSIDASINKMWNLEISADMLFATNHWDIPADHRQEAQSIGDALVPLLGDRASAGAIAMLMVIGHTDQDGKPDENLELSTKRAVSLVELWQKKHFPDSETDPAQRCVAAKIVAAGMGENRPLISDENVGNKPGNACSNRPTEYSGCRKNRRIEIRVVPKDERTVEILGCR